MNEEQTGHEVVEKAPTEAQLVKGKPDELPDKDAPYVNFKKIMEESIGQYKAIARFTDGSKMEFVLNKDIPYDVQEKMYDEDIITFEATDDEDAEGKKKSQMQVDLKRWMRHMWDHVVVSSEPSCDKTDLSLLPSKFAQNIIGFVFEQWEKNAPNIPELKKNSLLTSKG